MQQLKKSEEQTRIEHGERIFARERENRSWKVEEMDAIGKIQDLTKRLKNFISIVNSK